MKATDILLIVLSLSLVLGFGVCAVGLCLGDGDDDIVKVGFWLILVSVVCAVLLYFWEYPF